MVHVPHKSGMRGFTLIELMIVIAIISILASILVPNFLRAREQAMYTACIANTKTLATALEMYATDHNSRYPKAGSISKLIPSYLKSLPLCPASGIETYSPSYKSRATPDKFTFYCSGDNHEGAGIPPNYPQYISDAGTILPP